MIFAYNIFLNAYARARQRKRLLYTMRSAIVDTYHISVYLNIKL